jgi:hypothetical protein
VRPSRTRPVQHAGRERPGSIGVACQQGVRGSRRHPVSGQCSVAREQRSPLHRGRCSGVPLPGSPLVRCAYQVLRELLVRAGGSFGSVPDPGERVWIGGENIRECAMC